MCIAYCMGEVTSVCAEWLVRTVWRRLIRAYSLIPTLPTPPYRPPDMETRFYTPHNSQCAVLNPPPPSSTSAPFHQVSDGAAASMLMTRATAAQHGLRPLGVFRAYAVVGVPPEVMGIGPAVAIPVAVSRAGLELPDIDIFELNEAFASQATYCVKVSVVRRQTLL